MAEFNQFQDRVDKLALAYMEHTCDISKMTVAEFIKKFNEICNELIDNYESK